MQHLFKHCLHRVCKAALGTKQVWVVPLVRHHRHFSLLLAPCHLSCKSIWPFTDWLPEAFPSEKTLETQSPQMKVFFLWEHLPFTPTLYFACVILFKHISDIKSIFLWLSNKVPTHLLHILLYVQHIVSGLERLYQNISLACHTTLEKGCCGSEKLDTAGLAMPAWLNSLSSSWWHCDGHVPLLGTAHCTPRGERVSMGMDRKNASGMWQQRGKCGPGAEGRRWSSDNRHGRCAQCNSCLGHSNTAFLQQSQAPDTHGNVWSKEEFLSLEDTQFREHLNQLDIQKSVAPDGKHPWVLRELANVATRPLSNMLKRLWWPEEVAKDRDKANMTPTFKKNKKNLGNHRLVSLTLGPGKIK